MHPTPAQLVAHDALPGSYVVAFRLPAGGPGLRFASFAAEFRSHYGFLAPRFAADPRVTNVRVLSGVDLSPSPRRAGGFLAAPRFLAQLAPASVAGDAKPASLAQVDFTDPVAARAVLAEWERDGVLWFAEPNYVSHLSQATTPPASNLFQSFSTAYGRLATDDWWLRSVNLTQAFDAIASRDQSQPGTPSDTELGTDRPIVAVLDSGVDYGHPALARNIWQNTDVNASGCKNDQYGCNTTVSDKGSLGNGDVWPYDTTGPNQSCAGKDENCSHGTHVAGLIAADVNWTDPDSGRSVGGVCPVCRIMILKIVSKVGSESGILDSSILAAFKYVTLFRRAGSPAVRVMNASFGKFVRSRAVGLLVREMKESNGTLLVAAAGNEDTLTQEYPAAFADAVGVAAVDVQLKKVSFSNFGRWVSISAPGQDMLSTVPGSGLDSKSGTSMASPMVAGAAGLLLARFPGMPFDDLRSALLDTADPTMYGPDYQGGYNYQYYDPKIPQSSVRQPLLGHGLLNVQAAINRTPVSGQPQFTALNRVKPGCSVVGAGNGRTGLALLFVLGLFPAVAQNFRRRRPRPR